MLEYSFKNRNPELNDYTLCNTNVQLHLYESSKTRLSNGF